MDNDSMEAKDIISDDELEVTLPDPMVKPVPVQDTEREMAQPKRPLTPLPFLIDEDPLFASPPQLNFFEPIQENHSRVNRQRRFYRRNSLPYNADRLHKPIALRPCHLELDPTSNWKQISTRLGIKKPLKNSKDKRSFTLDTSDSSQQCCPTTSKAPISDSLPPNTPPPQERADAMGDLVEEIRAWSLSMDGDVM